MKSKYTPNTIENLLKPQSPVELYHILSIKKRKEYVKNLKDEIVNSIMEAERYSRKYPNAYKLNLIVNKERGEEANMNTEEIAKNLIKISETIEIQKNEIAESMKKMQEYNDFQKKKIDEQLKELQEYNNLQKDKLNKFIIKN
jgi:hypothetical protein